MTDRVVTHSELAHFRLCKRLHYFGYILLRRPRHIAAPMAWGTLLHHGLEAWWGTDIAKLDAARSAVAAGWETLSESAELDDYHLAALDVILEAYDQRWSQDIQLWEVIAVEEKFETKVYPPPAMAAGQPGLRRGTGPQLAWADLAGKVDGVLRRRDTGRVWLLEHKGTQADLSVGGPYWLRLRMDSQPSTYLEAYKHLEPEGILYDVVVRPTHRPYQATPTDKRQYTKGKPCKACKITRKVNKIAADADWRNPGCPVCHGSNYEEEPRLYAGQRMEQETVEEYRARVQTEVWKDIPKYFGRAEVVRLPAEMAEFRADTAMTVKSLRDAERFGQHPRNPDACTQNGRVCSYFGVCTGSESIEDDELFRTAEVPHEELR